MSNRPATKNAASGATDHGVKLHAKRDISRAEDTPKPRLNAMSKFAKPAHKAAARMTGYALTLGSFEAWEAASAVWQARLSPEECAALAWAALRSLDLDHARKVANTVIQDTGAPLPAFLAPMDEAAWWADMASPEELEAYCLASFNAMPRGRRAAFLDYVKGRAAA